MSTLNINRLVVPASMRNKRTGASGLAVAGSYAGGAGGGAAQDLSNYVKLTGVTSQTIANDLVIGGILSAQQAIIGTSGATFNGALTINAAATFNESPIINAAKKIFFGGGNPLNFIDTRDGQNGIGFGKDVYIDGKLYVTEIFNYTQDFLNIGETYINLGTEQAVNADGGIRIYGASSALLSTLKYQVSDSRWKLDKGLDITGTLSATGYNNSNWDSAYGWGDHRAANGASAYLGATYIGGGQEKPDYFNSGKLKLQMLWMGATNMATGYEHWGDVLWLSSYTDTDVKLSTAIVSSKNTNEIGFIKQNYDSTSWGTYYSFWTSANSNLSTIDWNAKNISLNQDVIFNAQTVIHTIWGGAFGGVVQILTDGATINRWARIGIISNAGGWQGGITIDNDLQAIFDTRIGVGTAAPSVYLGYGSITTNGTSGGVYDIKVNGVSASYYAADANHSYIHEIRNKDFSIYTNSIKRVNVTGDGNVGIGTDTIEGRLTISAPSGFYDAPNYFLNYKYAGYHVFNMFMDGSWNMHLRNPNSSGGFSFDTNATPRVTIGLNGELGSPTHANGFTGNGWYIDNAGNAYFKNLEVREGLRIFSLEVEKLTVDQGSRLYTNGALIVGVATNTFYYDNLGYALFAANGILRCEQWNGGTSGDILKFYQVKVVSDTVSTTVLGSDGSYAREVVYTDFYASVGAVAVGDSISRVSGSVLEVSSREGGFMQIANGITTTSGAGSSFVPQIRWGNVDGQTFTGGMRAGSGYGIVSPFFIIDATGANIANWAFTKDYLSNTGNGYDIYIASNLANVFGGTVNSARPGITMYNTTYRSMICLGNIYKNKDYDGIAIFSDLDNNYKVFEVSQKATDGTLIAQIAGWNFNTSSFYNGGLAGSASAGIEINATSKYINLNQDADSFIKLYYTGASDWGMIGKKDNVTYWSFINGAVYAKDATFENCFVNGRFATAIDVVPLDVTSNIAEITPSSNTVALYKAINASVQTKIRRGAGTWVDGQIVRIMAHGTTTYTANYLIYCDDASFYIRMKHSGELADDTTNCLYIYNYINGTSGTDANSRNRYVATFMYKLIGSDHWLIEI